MNKINITGPAGQLEAIVETPEQARTDIIAILCHPHPLHGGTMHNKVVTTLARTFRDLNITSVRFNYRGVEGSEGEYGDVVGETEDLYAVANWVKQQYPQAYLALAGFSFGTIVVQSAAETLQPKVLISVAPPVPHYDFDSLPRPHCPWIVVQGEDDEVFDATAVFDWIEQMTEKPVLIRMPETTHFFHGKLIELREKLVEELTAIFPPSND